MNTLEKLYEIAHSLQEKAEALRAEESSDGLANIISILPELADEDEDATYRVNVDYFDGISDTSLQVLIEESFKPVLGDVEIKRIVDNGRQYEDGYTYFSVTFYI